MRNVPAILSLKDKTSFERLIIPVISNMYPVITSNPQFVLNEKNFFIRNVFSLMLGLNCNRE